MSHADVLQQKSVVHVLRPRLCFAQILRWVLERRSGPDGPVSDIQAKCRSAPATDRDLSPRPDLIGAQEFAHSFPPLSWSGTVLAVRGSLPPCLLACP